MTPFYSAQIAMSITFPDTNIAPEKMMVERLGFPLGPGLISLVMLVLRRVDYTNIYYIYIYMYNIYIYDWNRSIHWPWKSSSSNLSGFQHAAIFGSTQFSIRPTSSKVISHTLPFILEAPSRTTYGSFGGVAYIFDKWYIDKNVWNFVISVGKWKYKYSNVYKYMLHVHQLCWQNHFICFLGLGWRLPIHTELLSCEPETIHHRPFGLSIWFSNLSRVVVEISK